MQLTKWILLILVTGLISACGPTAEEVAATVQVELDRSATSTAEALPTITPTATITPTPSPTDIPTNTPSPTPIPTSAFVPDVNILSAIEFDNESPLPSYWWQSRNISVSDGLLHVMGIPEWEGTCGAFPDQKSIEDGETLLIRFNFRPGTTVDLKISTDGWDTPSFKMWGTGTDAIWQPFFRVYSHEGDSSFGNWQQRSWTSFTYDPAPDRWHIAMIHVGGTEPFVIRVWDEEDPSLYKEAFQTFPEEWAGQDWWLCLHAGEGTTEDSGYDVDRIEFLDGLPSLDALTAAP